MVKHPDDYRWSKNGKLTHSGHHRGTVLVDRELLAHCRVEGIHCISQCVDLPRDQDQETHPTWSGRLWVLENEQRDRDLISGVSL